MQESDAGATYRVLGPLDLAVAGQRVNLGGKRQRMVLAVLLVNANSVVGQDSLVEAVWSGDAPASGARTLHTYISVLRKATGGAIEREGGGYILRASAGSIDAAQFTICLDEGRRLFDDDPETAARSLHRGLGLWTGPAYGDLGGEPALVPVANRLTNERAEALELRFRADLALGRHAQVIPEVDALLREEPLREGLASILMVALYRAGRPADALRVYQRVRSDLVEQLGIDPGPELQRLELRILDRDPELAPSPAGSRSGPARGTRGYELHETAGASDFGRRHRGFQGAIAREVCVLWLTGPEVADPAFTRRFQIGMEVVMRLEHPHLAPVLDHWRDTSGAYVVTPHYRGGSLETLLDDGPLQLGDAIRIVDGVAAALDVIHRQGLAHGAVSARSVLLDEERNPYLTDLGLRQVFDGPTSAHPATDIADLGTLALSMVGQDAELPPGVHHAVARARHPEPDLRFARADDFARALRQAAGFDVVPWSAPTGEAIDRRNPYKGLAAFQESDEADFHGRDELVEELLAAMDDDRRGRLVAVVGPSGSGKSSVVRAGVLPRVRSGAVTGSETWLVTMLFPGTHPFEALAEALLQASAAEADELWPMLTGAPDGLVDAIDLLVPPPGPDVLIVVDQFEELFAPSVTTDERRRFLDLLTAACTSGRSRVRLLVTLRADFFDHPLGHPGFAEVFRECVVAVGPPTVDGLTRAITQPALRSGVSVEPGLVARVVADARDQPGGLPPLQFVLTELFAERSGDVMTLEAYEKLGGVAGALANRAEAAHAVLDPAQRELARQLFLRLVTVDEFSDDTRRRVARRELLDLEGDRAAMDDLIHRFGALRFLSFDRDPVSRGPTVELAHEALLQRWERLAGWIDERREDLLIHRRLQLTAADWEANDRDPSYLLRGGRLDQAVAWLERTDLLVADGERQLLDQSETAAAEETAAAVSAERRRRRAAGVLVALLLAAGGIGLYALGQRGQARTSATDSASRELALASVIIAEDDPELGVLLAAEALRITEAAGLRPLPEALGAIWSAHVANRTVLRLDDVGTQAIAFHPDGEILAVDAGGRDSDGLVTLRDATTGAAIGTLPSSPDVAASPVAAMEFSADGSSLLVTRSGADDGATALLEVFDVAGRTRLREIELPLPVAAGLSVSRSGLAAVVLQQQTGPSQIAVVDPSSGRTVQTIGGTELGPSYLSRRVDFVAETDRLVVGLFTYPDPDVRRLLTIDARSAEIVADVGIGIAPTVLRVRPDGRRVAVGDEAGGLIGVFDPATGRASFDPVEHQSAQLLEWSSDGDRLAVSGNESDITLLDADTGQVELILSGHGASVYGTAFHPTRPILASVSVDSEVRWWDISAAGPAGLAATGGDLNRIDATERLVMASVIGTGAHAIDASSGATVANSDIAVAGYDGARAATEAGVVAGSLPDGSIVLTDLATGATTAELGFCGWAAGISPDARYLVTERDDPNKPGCESRQALNGIVDLESGGVVVDNGDRWTRWGDITGVDTFDDHRYAAVTLLLGEEEAEVEIRQLDTDRLLGTLTMDLTGTEVFLLPEFSSDARLLGIGTNGPSALVVDVEALAGGATIEDSIVFNQRVHTSNTRGSR